MSRDTTARRQISFAEWAGGAFADSRSEHPNPFNSLHEGYAVLLEEVDEAKAEVFRRIPNLDRLGSKLQQAGAACWGIAEDLMPPSGAEGFAAMVDAELKRACSKHPAFPTLHHGYAVLLEEVDEFWDEVKKREPDATELLSELVQTATMCLRFHEDLVVPHHAREVSRSN